MHSETDQLLFGVLIPHFFLEYPIILQTGYQKAKELMDTHLK